MKSLTNYFQYKKRDDGKHSDIIIKIKYLIKKLKNADDESIFAQKYQNLFGDDYKDVIKHPININQIIKKNNRNFYNDLESFKDDVQLMFNNMFVYHSQNSVQCSYTLKVKQIFDNELIQLENESSSLNINPNNSDLIQNNESSNFDSNSNNNSLTQNDDANHQVNGYFINNFDIIPSDLSSESENDNNNNSNNNNNNNNNNILKKNL